MYTFVENENLNRTVVTYRGRPATLKDGRQFPVYIENETLTKIKRYIALAKEPRPSVSEVIRTLIEKSSLNQAELVAVVDYKQKVAELEERLRAAEASAKLWESRALELGYWELK